MTRCLIAILLASASLVAQTPASAVEAIINLDKSDSRVMEHLDQLVNGIGPRLTGSENLTTASHWAMDKFKSFGLEARIEQWGTFPVGFNRGPFSGRITTPETLELDFTTSCWTPGTTGRQSGRVLMPPEEATEEFAKNPEGYRGSWLLGMPKGLSRQDRDAVLTRAGVLGVINRTAGQGKERDVLVLTGGNQNVKWESLPKTCVIQLQAVQFDKIKEMVKAGKTVEAAFDIRNHFKKGPIPLYNVIAELKGTEKPDEYVIVGGHLDSWDGATGTTDNGTGTATTIEAARLIAASGCKPRRTIRFMLWSGEEQGLLGSAAFVAQHEDELPRVSVCLVHDGGTNYVSGISATEEMAPAFETIFAPVMTLDPAMPFKINKGKNLPFMGGSDHASYYVKGVPGIFWNQAGRADYTHTHHTQFDTYDAAIPEYQRHTSVVVAIGALGIANLPGLLSRENMRGGTEATRGPRRQLGLDYASDDSLEVSDVTEGSIAAKAGIRLKDKLIKIDGKSVKDRFEVREALRAGEQEKKIAILRDGKEMEFAISFSPPKPPEPAKDPAKKDG